MSHFLPPTRRREPNRRVFEPTVLYPLLIGASIGLAAGIALAGVFAYARRRESRTYRDYLVDRMRHDGISVN